MSSSFCVCVCCYHFSLWFLCFRTACSLRICWFPPRFSSSLSLYVSPLWLYSCLYASLCCSTSSATPPTWALNLAVSVFNYCCLSFSRIVSMCHTCGLRVQKSTRIVSSSSLHLFDVLQTCSALRVLLFAVVLYAPISAFVCPALALPCLFALTMSLMVVITSYHH